MNLTRISIVRLRSVFLLFIAVLSIAVSSMKAEERVTIGLVPEMNIFAQLERFAGSHDAAIDAVWSGKADIGAAKNTIYDRYIKENPQAGQDLIIIAGSEDVPTNGLCVMASVSQETRMKLKKALLQMDGKLQGQRILEKFGALKFVETNGADYDPVIQMTKKAGLNLSDYLVDSRKSE